MVTQEAECLFDEFKLVTLWELLLQYADDELVFGPFANIFFCLGRLDCPAPISDIARIEMTALLEICLKEMDRFGLRVSASNTRSILRILEGTSPSTNLHDHILVLRSALHTELQTSVFLPVDHRMARYYREPRRDWQEVIKRFAGAVSDIEEASKCYALGRYAASVYHSMQILEVGLLELGRFMQINDPKSGFTAVANALDRVLAKKYDTLTAFEKQHRPFFEQVNNHVQAVKNACRNKISHVEGRLVLMTADFSPQVAEEIFIATRAFMRRLATELPS